MPETNIVFFDTTGAGISPVDFVPRLLKAGVRMGHISRRVRAVTHLDVSREDIERTIKIVWGVLSQH
jgi:threonine aldolase